MKKILSGLIFLLSINHAVAQPIPAGDDFADRAKNLLKHPPATSVGSPYAIKIGQSATPAPTNDTITTVIPPSSSYLPGTKIPSNFTTGMNGTTQFNNTIPIGTNFTQATPTMVKGYGDANLINYRTCVKVLINNNMAPGDAMAKCHQHNEGIIDPSERNETVTKIHIPPVKQTTVIAPVDIDHQIIKPGSGYIGPPIPASVVSTAISGGGDAEFIGPSGLPPTNIPAFASNCDVSKDVRVLLSPNCSGKLDAALMGDMPVALSGGNGRGLNVPEPTQGYVAPTFPETQNTTKMTCQITFVSKGGKSEEDMFYPQSGIDCVKRALVKTTGIEGRINIILTDTDGSVSSASCERDSNKKPVCHTE